jgi:hypothetical protein
MSDRKFEVFANSGNASWEMICIYDLTLSKMRGGETGTSTATSKLENKQLKTSFI